MAEVGIEVTVYGHADPLTPLDVLNGRMAPAYLEELKGDGGGSITISLSDPKLVTTPSLLAYRNILKVKVAGKVVGAMLVQKKGSKIIDATPNAEVTLVSGVSLRGWFNDSQVYSEGGGIRKQAQGNRAFNFATTRGLWYNASQWKVPVNVSGWGNVAGSPWRYCPAEWPDVRNAKWVWSQNSLTGAPVGDNYFRYEFTAPAANKYSLFLAADDSFSVYIDGQLNTQSDPTVSAFHEVERVDVDLLAGNHVIGIKVHNKGGPAALIAALFYYGDPLVPTAATLVTYTGLTVASATSDLNIVQTARNKAYTDWQNAPVGPKKDTAYKVLQVWERSLDSAEDTLAAIQAGAVWVVAGYPDPVPGWSPGEIVLTLLAEAEARGVRSAGYFTPTFTALVDSYGQPWSRSLDFSFDIGTSLTAVIAKLEELVCDVWIDPDTFELNMAAERGVDKSIFTGTSVIIPPVVFEKGKNLGKSTSDGVGDMTNALLMETADGWVEVADAGSSTATYGRLESFLQTDASANVASAIASSVFKHKADPEEGASYTIIPAGGDVPFVDFNVGDWVLAPNDLGLGVKRRVVSLSVEEDDAGNPKYSVEFDTIFQDDDAKLNNWLQKLGGGSLGGQFSNSGGGSSSPNSNPTIIVPAVPPAKIPVDPDNLDATSVGTWSPNGVEAISEVTLTWDAVVTNTDGTETVPVSYEVWAKLNAETDDKYLLYATSTTNSALIRLRPSELWVFKVRALNSATAIGSFSTVITHTTLGPTVPMSAPTKAILSTEQQIIRVTWDGQLVGPKNPDPQFRFGYAQVSPFQANTWSRKGSIFQRGGGTISITGLDANTKYDVQLFVVDGVGITSAASEIATITNSSINLASLDPSVAQAIQDANDAALAAQGAATAAGDASVTGMVDEWAVSASPTVAPSSGWSTTTPAWTPGNYIWQRTTVTFGSGSSVTASPVLVTGNTGATGKGISSAAITYQASSSGTVVPTGSWLGSVPVVAAGQFLWTRTITTYTDTTTSTSYSVGGMGTNGSNGTPGAPGADGQTSYLHVAYATNSTGTTGFSTTDPSGKTYMGTYSDFTVADSANAALYTWSLIKGADGSTGSPGAAGKGISSSTVTYQVSSSGTTAPTGTWLSSVPATPENQFLWTRTVLLFTDSATTTIYSVAKQGAQGLQGIQGPDGEQGIPGNPGADGTPSYTHIAYADDASGGGFSQLPAGKEYMGVYVDSTSTDSSTPSLYAWSLIKGADGANGTPGAPGADGQTPYFHTAWSDAADGSVNFSTTVPGTRTYLGVYTDFTPADSATPSTYAWSKIQGPTGSTGAAGKGVTSAAVTYQASASGTTPPVGTWTTSVPVVSAGQFLWTRTITTYTDATTSTAYSVGGMGTNGSNGTPGAPGTDGQTSYLHVAYATNSTGSTGFSTTDPTGKTYMGTYTDFVLVDSATPSAYTWVLIKGADGTDGSTGPTGKGISSSTVTYQVGSSGTTTPTGTWVSTVPATPEGQFLWTRTIIQFTDGASTTAYSVAKQGPTGSAGNDGVTWYNHFAYADTVVGGGFSFSPTGKAYLGVYSDTNFAGPSDPSKYTWSLIKGTDGAAGKGISSTSTTYQASSSGTTVPTGSWLGTVPSVPAGQFLWTRTITTYTDSTTSTAYSVGGMGTNGSNGTPGTPGTNGQTSYFHVAYATNSTGTTGFSTTDPSGKTYMGTYTDFTLADSSNPALYAWALIKGADGSTGPTGKGISSSAVTYQVSSSGTVTPTGTWLSSVPATPEGQFLWTRTVITFTDAATTTSYSVAKQGPTGATGSPGSTGPQGTSVTSVARYYQLATSAPAKPSVNPPGGLWTTTEPGYEPDVNLYFVDLAVLSNGSFVYSNVSLSSAYVAAAQAAQAAVVSQRTADGKNTIYISTVEPSGGVEVIRNIATNPSFESTTPGSTVLRTNLAQDPLGVNTAPSGIIGWGEMYFEVAGTDTYIPEPTNVGTAGFRRAVSNSGNDSGFVWFHTPFDSFGKMPVTPGTTYAVSSYARMNSTVFEDVYSFINVNFYDSAGTYVGSDSGDINYLGPDFSRASHVTTIPANVAYAGWSTIIEKYSGNLLEIGFASDVTGLLFETGPSVQPYFDGNTPNGSGLVYAWTGESNVSTSTLVASDPVTVRANYASDPMATTVGSPVSGEIHWTARWFGSGGAGTQTSVVDAADGPIPEITTYQRKTWTVAAPSGDTAWSLTSASPTGTASTAGFAVSAGESYAVSAYLRAGSTTGKTIHIDVLWRNSSGTYISASSSTNVALVPGQWERPSSLVVAPAGASYAEIILYLAGSSSWAIGDTLDGTGALVELSTILGDVFSGSTPSAGDFSYAWVGAKNNSASIQTALSVNGLSGHPTNGSKVYQSKEWASSGISSAAISPSSIGSSDTFAGFSVPVVQGSTYTIIGTANMPADSYPGSGTRTRTICIYGGQAVTGGVETASESAPIGIGTVSLSFTAQATGTASVRLYSGALTETVHWDDLLIVEGDYGGPYFDGNTRPADGFTYTWDGAKDASESVKNAGGPVPGDQWWILRADSDGGQLTGIKLWSGSEWINYTIVADSIFVPGSVGATLIADGAITTSKVFAHAIGVEQLDPLVGDTININGNVAITSVAQAVEDTNGNLQQMQMHYGFDDTALTISSPIDPLDPDASSTTIAISNKEIAIMANGDKVSYWNSTQMVVTSLIVDTIIIGNHQIEKYAKGGTVVRALTA